MWDYSHKQTYILMCRKLRKHWGFLLPFGHEVSVFDLWSFKPDVRRRFDHGSLDHSHQPSMHLADLREEINSQTKSLLIPNTRKAELSFTIIRSYEDWTHALTRRNTYRDTHKLFYQRVAAIIRQDDNINGRCVIGHTDTAVLWFVLSEMKQVCLRHRHTTWWQVKKHQLQKQKD